MYIAPLPKPLSPAKSITDKINTRQHLKTDLQNLSKAYLNSTPTARTLSVQANPQELVHHLKALNDIWQYLLHAKQSCPKTQTIIPSPKPVILYSSCYQQLNAQIYNQFDNSLSELPSFTTVADKFAFYYFYDPSIWQNEQLDKNHRHHFG